MWLHIEPDRLLAVVEGGDLTAIENAHMSYCEFCQQLFLFFIEQKPLITKPKPDVKAA